MTRKQTHNQRECQTLLEDGKRGKREKREKGEKGRRGEGEGRKESEVGKEEGACLLTLVALVPL